MKKSLVTGVAGAAFALSLSAPAQADIFAYANILTTGFTILGSDGQILDNNTDLLGLTYTSSGDMDGSLTGTAGFNNSIPNAGGDIDFTTQCLTTTGDCNPLGPDNSFPFMTAPLGTDFVAADQWQVDSPVLNVGALGAPATIGAIAAGSLSATSAAGSANVNNGLEANWQFSLTQAQGITFTGDIRTYLEAFASAGEVAPGKASASTEFQITISELATGLVVFDSNDSPFDLQTDFVNQTTSANANNFAFDIRTCGDFAALPGGCGNEVNASFSLTTGLLQAGVVYQLSARQNVNIDLARVEMPEPGILALMGVGFLSIFAAGRRRRRV